MTDSAARQQLEQAAIGEAIRELSGQGWTVVEPKSALADWLPESLRRFQPDLIAVKDGQITVIEVRSRYSPGAESLGGLAEAVAAVPNASFDVLWVGAMADTATAEFSTAPMMRRLAEARELVTTGHLEAAALIAWSALEGALVRHAIDLQVQLPADATGATLPWRLLAELDSLGYLNDGDMQRLSEVRRQRNAAAHFMETADPPRTADVEYCLDIVDRMLSGQYVTIDQMVDWHHKQEKEPAVGTDRLQIRQLLIENFPGARSPELDQTVDQLLQQS